MAKKESEKKTSVRIGISETSQELHFETSLEASKVISLASAAPVVATPTRSPLESPDGRAVRVVHVVAELAPFARSGGLGEAVNSLARFQADAGVWTAIVMPLYDAVRATGPDIEPVGRHFRNR